MPLSTQEVHARSLERAYQLEISNFIAQNSIARLWAKDLTLWPAPATLQKTKIANLNWLDLPQQMHGYMLQVIARTEALEKHGFETLVFVGMGASNLVADTIQRMSVAKRGRRFFVLDSIDPAAIQKLDGVLDLRTTLFVFATKSGKLIETHALLLHFLDMLRGVGITNPGGHFIAVTEKNSYLARLAVQYRFREVFHDPPGIQGRFSSLIHFGLLLSAVGQIDPAILSSRGIAMQNACGPQSAPQTNPALTLAAFLAAGVAEGKDRLFLASSPALASVTRSLAQLIGFSTGKERQGIVPIFGTLPCALELSYDGCLVAALALRGELDDAAAKQLNEHLAQKSAPSVIIEIDGPEDLGAELFKWELATALICSRLGVNPFDQPDAQRSRAAAQRGLEDIVARREFQLPTIRLNDSGIGLRAETVTRQEISTRNLSEAFRTFLDLRRADGYLAILAFLEESPEIWASLERLRTQLEARVRIPVQLSFGPRYLHYLGQVYKGGPAKGLFVILTAEPGRDIPVPGAGYSFGQLQTALARGDFEALYQRNQHVLWLHFAEGTEQGFGRLDGALASGARSSSPDRLIHPPLL